MVESDNLDRLFERPNPLEGALDASSAIAAWALYMTAVDCAICLLNASSVTMERCCGVFSCALVSPKGSAAIPLVENEFATLNEAAPLTGAATGGRVHLAATDASLPILADPPNGSSDIVETEGGTPAGYLFAGSAMLIALSQFDDCEMPFLNKRSRSSRRGLARQGELPGSRHCTQRH